MMNFKLNTELKNSYQERWRDWPFEASASVFETVLIPEARA